MDDLERYIGTRTENGTQYPAVNLAGASYTRPANTVGLGQGKFAVLSGLPSDTKMIETLKGYAHGSSSKETSANADKAQKNKSTQRLQPSGDVSPGGDDAGGTE